MAGEEVKEEKKEVKEEVGEYDDIDLKNLGEIELDRKESPFTFRDKKYKLVELSGLEREQYNDEVKANNMEKQADGDFMVVKNEGLLLALLKRTVYDVETNKPVAPEVIANWSESSQKFLWRASRKLAGLDAKSKAEAKNS